MRLTQNGGYPHEYTHFSTSVRSRSFIAQKTSYWLVFDCKIMRTANTALRVTRRVACGSLPDGRSDKARSLESAPPAPALNRDFLCGNLGRMAGRLPEKKWQREASSPSVR